MALTARQEEILEIISQKKTATVNFLAEKLFVATMTIRRDLKELESLGRIKRYHGGAMIVDEDEFTIDMRLNLSVKEKNFLGQQAIKWVKDYDVIFLDCSSTCHYLLPYLKKFFGIKIITNSIDILLTASKMNIPCVISGGTYIAKEMSLQGASACEFLSKLNFDVAFFSSFGYSENGDITDHDEELTKLRQTVMRRSNANIFMFDKSKQGKRSLYTLCNKKDVDEVICS